ncbi:MAG: rRNA maturation RNase YbeY [Patescibacteria group bacterium]
MKAALVNRTTFRVPRRVLLHDVRAAAAAIRRERPSLHLPGEITIVVVPDRESARLNREFRGRSKPTNVLSFNYGSGGEIVIAPAVVRREARAEGQPPSRRFRHMVVHGILHLAGCHHETSRQAGQRFRRMERELLTELGIL